MKEAIKIVEAIGVISCVIILVWAGIVIGGEFGSFGKFVLAVLESINKKAR